MLRYDLEDLTDHPADRLVLPGQRASPDGPLSRLQKRRIAIVPRVRRVVISVGYRGHVAIGLATERSGDLSHDGLSNTQGFPSARRRKVQSSSRHEIRESSDDIDLRTSYLGLELRNPLVAAASPLTGHLDSLCRIEEAGRRRW